MPKLVRKHTAFGYTTNCALYFMLTAIFTGGQLFGGYAPFGLGMIAAAGSGCAGLFALLGALVGALFLMQFSFALRYLSIGILIYTANNAFHDTKLYQRKFFPPLLTAFLTVAVEFAYVIQADIKQAVYCFLYMGLTYLASDCYRTVFHEHDVSEAKRDFSVLLLILGLLLCLASFQFPNGFAPGRILTLLLIMYVAYQRGTSSAIITALSLGLTMDFAAETGTFLYAVTYSFSAFAMNFRRRGRRITAVLLFCFPALCLLLPLSGDIILVSFYEIACASLLFLLLPKHLFREKRHTVHEKTILQETQEISDAQRKLEQSAAVFRDLYDSVVRLPALPQENVSIVFDRAAETICCDCSLKNYCWKEVYQETFQAFNAATPALLEHGQGRKEDFPMFFAERCIHLNTFLSAVNRELTAFLLRRQYRNRLLQAQAHAVSQYAELSELLLSAADRCVQARPAVQTLLPYRVGFLLRPKEGENVSGDSMNYFETENASLCMILSDGMGSGEYARRESALTVRLLERFLRAGIDAPPALKTLNTALTLRTEVSERFTTIDLLVFSLKNGEAETYKYGAAPSYVKKNGNVRRVSCSCLPAGLQESDTPPETTRFRLESGTYFVMITDGVADSKNDEWLKTLLANWKKEDPQALAAAILAESRHRCGVSDDGGVLVLYLPSEKNAQIQEI